MGARRRVESQVLAAELLRLLKERSELEDAAEAKVKKIEEEAAEKVAPITARIAVLVTQIQQATRLEAQNGVHLAAPDGTAASGLPPLPLGARGQGERLLALLRERQHPPLPWIAEKLYGDASLTKRVGSLLDYMRVRGRVVNKGHGKWEVAMSK